LASYPFGLRKITNSHYYDAKVSTALFPCYIIAFWQLLLLWRRCYDVRHVYTASFMTCSETEGTGLRLTERTALLDDALRVAEEEAVGSLEKIEKN